MCALDHASSSVIKGNTVVNTANGEHWPAAAAAIIARAGPRRKHAIP